MIINQQLYRNIPDIEQRALAFAKEAHKEQIRKYSGENYVVHCIEVAEIVRSFGGTISMVVAAYLHDTIEDCGVTKEDILLLFGAHVAELVLMLTDVSTAADGKRSSRKAKERNHIAKASKEAKTIKLADIISNIRSIVKHDKSFAKVYLKEKELLLEVLKEGNKDLYQVADKMVKKGLINLSIA
jgi:(p)ppGpp synthase/HD superfamily hydrolase